jgi:hypothetical protein
MSAVAVEDVEQRIYHSLLVDAGQNMVQKRHRRVKAIGRLAQHLAQVDVSAVTRSKPVHGEPVQPGCLGLSDVTSDHSWII